MEYSLIVRNIGELTNKELVKEIKAIDKLEGSTQANKWKQAEHYRNIVTGELFLDDFDSLTDFAKVIGSAKQTISQLVRAVEYAEETGVDREKWTINKVYILSCIENVAEFMVWLKDSHKELNIQDKDDLRMYGDNFIKKLVQEYKKSKEPVKAIEEKQVESTDVTEEKEQDTHEPIKVEYEGKVAYIPYSVFLQYVAEEQTEEQTEEQEQ